MLLNKIPCLDKGYTALLSSSNDSRKIADIRDEFFGARDNIRLFELGTLTLVFKCPLFVQLNFSKFNLTVITGQAADELDAYVPNAGEIGSPDTETNRAIADDILRTTEALVINPRAYQSDGCDKFISQIVSPVNIYTTLIVHGSYNEWKKYCQQANLPAPIESYRLAVEQIYRTEWK